MTKIVIIITYGWNYSEHFDEKSIPLLAGDPLEHPQTPLGVPRTTGL